jgi:hypothetical protein
VKWRARLDRAIAHAPPLARRQPASQRIPPRASQSQQLMAQSKEQFACNRIAASSRTLMRALSSHPFVTASIDGPQRGPCRWARH